MILHVLTAITRPENLPRLSASLDAAFESGVEICWHTRTDPDRQFVGGQALKNEMLDDDNDSDGWVWILDDDNIAHPDLFTALMACVKARPEARLIVIAQQHRTRYIRRASRQMLRQTHVDAGQVVIRRDAIGERRIPPHYCGDGEWIETIANSLEDDQIAYIHEPVTYYNWLRNE